MKNNRTEHIITVILSEAISSSCALSRRMNLPADRLRPDFIGTCNVRGFKFSFIHSLLVFAVFISSCGPKEFTPVELFPEDECATCRMAVSSPEFASEIINVDGTVVKFDDLRCFENYRKTHPPQEFAAIYVMEYDSKQWMPFGKSIIIQTGIETPMGSGQIAVASQQRAKELKTQYPADIAAMEGDACCAPK